MPYTLDSSVSAYRITNSDNGSTCNGFAKNLCVVNGDYGVETVNLPDTEAALLCDLNAKNVLYSKNATETLQPASLTKVMTAIVALRYGRLDEMMTASNDVLITESGASLAGIKPGDTMTLEQALYALLMPSGNDAAIMIAEHIGGSIQGFVDMMNQEAKELGATGCHFMNPHGLTQDDHYVTAYDMYLIFNEAIKYDEFVKIINTPQYKSIYHDASGNDKELSFETTNQFLNGNALTPQGITVIGGKTGTTSAAGNCLVLLSQDTAGNPYISVILKASQRDILYTGMHDLIQKIGQ